MRDELGVELEERDYVRQPLGSTELAALFEGRDPRDFLNPRSPAYKARALAGRKLTPAQAIKLMVEDPNLIKRPLLVAGGELVAGFDRERLRAVLK